MFTCVVWGQSRIGGALPDRSPHPITSEAAFEALDLRSRRLESVELTKAETRRNLALPRIKRCEQQLL